MLRKSFDILSIVCQIYLAYLGGCYLFSDITSNRFLGLMIISSALMTFARFTKYSEILYKLFWRLFNFFRTRVRNLSGSERVYLNQLSITESFNIIVWSRSGPVEIKPISTPTAFDKNSTYSRAFKGKSSNRVTPRVSDFQPGKVS